VRGQQLTTSRKFKPLSRQHIVIHIVMAKGQSYKVKVRRGVLGIPSGTFDVVQVCKNGVLRLPAPASLPQSSQKG